MSRRVTHVCDKLSDWEVAELYVAYRSGVGKATLRRRYRMSGATLNKTIARFEHLGRRMRELETEGSDA